MFQLNNQTTEESHSNSIHGRPQNDSPFSKLFVRIGSLETIISCLMASISICAEFHPRTGAPWVRSRVRG